MCLSYHAIVKTQSVQFLTNTLSELGPIIMLIPLFVDDYSKAQGYAVT